MWNNLSTLTADTYSPVSEQRLQSLAREVLEGLARQEYLRDLVSELCAAARAADKALAALATTVVFRDLVEPLADSFEPAAVADYNRVFAQILQECRQSVAPRFDEELASFGLRSEQDLLARAERLREPRHTVDSWDRTLPACANQTPAGIGKVDRVFILSRVTLGADVAITSVLLDGMKHLYPDSELVLVGGVKMRELFGGDARLRFAEVRYERRATLAERLAIWLDLLDAVRAPIGSNRRERFLVVDSDSRLAQLGMLPVAEPSNYLFFPSREYGSSSSRSVGQLAADWLSDTLGVEPRPMPRVSIRQADQQTGRLLVNTLGKRPVAAVNFGIGENPAKRMPLEFESGLLEALLDRGFALALDSGVGQDEEDRTAAILGRLESSRPVLRTAGVTEESISHVVDREENKDVIIWKGRIGVFSGIVGASRLYIGYDSAGAHIAAALGIPVVEVFKGHSSARMLDRWRPVGPASVDVIAVEGSPGEAEVARLIEQVVESALKASGVIGVR